MKPQAIGRAARTLLAARKGGYKISGLPEECRPATVDEAYEIQERLLELIAEPGVGWFVSLTNPDMRRIHGLEAPYFGCLIAGALHQSPATIELGAGTCSLEIELTLRLGEELPSREQPYTVDEVGAAVAAVHPGLEVVDGRWEDISRIDGPSLVADNGTDGDLIIGPGVKEWRALDLTRLGVRLIVNGKLQARGAGADPTWDPLTTLAWLANERSRRGDGLRAGETVNTGNCLSGYCFGRAGDDVIADCGALGEARVQFT